MNGRARHTTRRSKCKVCGVEYVKQRIGQKTCSVACAIVLAKSQTAKTERRADREKRIKLKTRSDWLKDAQAVFNRWIRVRDDGQPCISCGRNSGAKMNAGHYRTVGSSPELRFNEENCHIQCEHCNSHLSGNIIEYRKRLIEKIGVDRVEWLEGKHEPLKLTIDEIIKLIEVYKDKIKIASSN